MTAMETSAGASKPLITIIASKHHHSQQIMITDGRANLQGGWAGRQAQQAGREGGGGPPGAVSASCHSLAARGVMGNGRWVHCLASNHLMFDSSPQVGPPALEGVPAPAVPGGVRLAAQPGIPHHNVAAQHGCLGKLQQRGWGGGAGGSLKLAVHKTCRAGTSRDNCISAPRTPHPAACHSHAMSAHLHSIHSDGCAIQAPVELENEEPGIGWGQRQGNEGDGCCGAHHALKGCNTQGGSQGQNVARTTTNPRWNPPQASACLHVIIASPRSQGSPTCAIRYRLEASNMPVHHRAGMHMQM